MPIERIELPRFHDEQIRIYKGLAPRTILRCGRRFGKTTLLETAACAWATRKEPVGWFCPSYRLLLPSYKRILRTLQPIVEHSSKVDGLIELTTGGSVEFWTLNDEDAGRSRAYKRVIIDEGSLVAKGLRDIWEQSIAPTLLDYGGTAVMAGTPKGIDPDNFFYVACTEPNLGWKEFHAPTALNPLLDAEAIEKLRLEFPPLVYQQEYLAEFVDWAGAAFFMRQNLLVQDFPVEIPKRVDVVFATIDSATKTGKEHDGTAVIYWGMQRVTGYPLTILDYDIVQIEGALLEVWLPTVFQNLEALATRCNARMGNLGAYIEDKASGMILLQQAQRRGWPATPIASELTAVGKDERAISVSGYVYRNKVKISAEAYDKVVSYKGQTRNHLLSQVTGFRIGVKDQQDDLLDCFTYGISIALGDSKGF